MSFRLQRKNELTDLVQRIRMEGIRNDEWFRKNYVPVRIYDDEDVNLDDVEAAFDESKVV